MSSPSPQQVHRTLARLWLASGAGIGLLAVVVVATSDAASTVPAVLPAVLVLVAAAGATVGVAAVDRSLAADPPTDDVAAAHEVRARAFLQLAIIEAPVLLGVALGFTIGPPWVAVVGAAGGLGALLVARPSRGRFARLDAAWRAAGHDVSVLRGLDPAGRSHPG